MALYVDIGIGVIALIALIVGIVKGFSKQFTKGLCGFIAFVGSIGLTLLLMPFIQKAGAFKSFADAATKWFAQDYFTVTITSTEELNQTLSQGFLRILAGLSDRIYGVMQANEMTTLGMYFGDLVARLIVGFILWIILLLLIKLIFLGIRKLLGKLAKLPVLHTLDKIFGGLWSVGITYLIAVCLLLTVIEIAILKLLPDFQPTLAQLAQDSHIFKFLHNTNVIGAYLADLFGVDLVMTAPAV